MDRSAARPAVVLRTGCTLYRARLHAAEKPDPHCCNMPPAHPRRPPAHHRPGRSSQPPPGASFPPRTTHRAPPTRPVLPPRTASPSSCNHPNRTPMGPAHQLSWPSTCRGMSRSSWTATAAGPPHAASHAATATRPEEMLVDVVHGALEIGLSHLTVYLLSTENLEKRPPQEIDKLLTFAREQLESGDFLRYDVRIRWAGLPDGLPATSSTSCTPTKRPPKIAPVSL
ncbi:undecaprenyl diphosphate synthase family protein [Streptomyces sp. M10(2022)]